MVCSFSCSIIGSHHLDFQGTCFEPHHYDVIIMTSSLWRHTKRVEINWKIVRISLSEELEWSHHCYYFLFIKNELPGFCEKVKKRSQTSFFFQFYKIILCRTMLESRGSRADNRLYISSCLWSRFYFNKLKKSFFFALFLSSDHSKFLFSQSFLLFK